MCRVATVLADKDVSLEDAEFTYESASHAGAFAISDLKRAERNLLRLGLALDYGDHIQVSNDMLSLLAGTIEDAHVVLLARQIEPTTQFVGAMLPSGLSPDQREALLLALNRRFEETRRREIGEVAERIVEFAARTELEDLGEFELARRVTRVSLVSDQLGYDIVAPSMSGRSRRFEVKGTTTPVSDTVRFYISRNEADYGECDPLWFLIACHVSDVELGEGEIMGWCSIDSITEFLPKDVPGGKWTNAEIAIPRAFLQPRIPSPYVI